MKKKQPTRLPPQWRRPNRSRGRPFVKYPKTHWELNEIQLCYFAALIDGLRIISQHAKDRPDLMEEFDAGPLVVYVQEKGRQIYTASRK